MAIDVNDPCALAAFLKEAYFAAISGNTETLIRTRGADSEQEVRYAKMDIATLRAEWQRAQDACDKLNGVVTTPRRFAITAGSRRIYTPPRG